MRIFFLLPTIRKFPVGGYKVVYEYANRLSKHGHDVVIGYDYTSSGMKIKKYFPDIVRLFLVKLVARYKMLDNPSWFNLSENIKQRCIFTEEDILQNSYDIVIATAIQTTRHINKIKNARKKLYLIQGFENWNGITDEEVHKSYNLGMTNIVICKWLKEIVDSATGNKKSILIPNGIDFTVFNIVTPIENRVPYVISMLYHKAAHKGSKYGIEALVKLKEIYPQLEANLFGVPERPSDLPRWIKYTQKATQKDLMKIYNSSAIFLCPTINEGFGLTGAESMACGCALVSTDYGGVHEYATRNKDVLLSPPCDVDAMVDNCIYLIENNQMRIELATRGHRDIRRLDWEKSVRRLEEIITA